MKIFVLFVVLFFTHTSIYSQVSDPLKNKRFFNITKLSYIDVKNATFDEFIPQKGNTSTNINTNDAICYSLQTISGYFLNPHLSVGIGIGLDGYHKPDFNTMPLFLDIRGYFVDNRNTAFAFLDIGTLLDAGPLYRKGTMAEIGIGYKFFASSKIAMIASINGSFKGLSLTNEGYRTADWTVVLRGIGVSVGFIF